MLRKNISKKEADLKFRKKQHDKLMRQSARDAKKKEEFQLRQMKKNQKHGVT